MTLKETSQEYNIPLHYLYKLSYQNKIPGLVRWGRKTLRVNKETLDKALENKTLGVDHNE
jgi:hypothetical protein